MSFQTRQRWTHLFQDPLVDLEPELLQEQNLHLRPLRREERVLSWTQMGAAGAAWVWGGYHSADVGQSEDLVRVDLDGVVDGEVVLLEQGQEDSKGQVASRLAPSLAQGLAQRDTPGMLS